MENTVHNCAKTNGYPMFFKRQKKDDKIIITGVNPRVEMNIGDTILLPNVKNDFTILNIKRRDCAGKFNNPEDSKDSFFEAECRMEKIV